MVNGHIVYGNGGHREALLMEWRGQKLEHSVVGHVGDGSRSHKALDAFQA